jgi:hypothetical protein
MRQLEHGSTASHLTLRRLQASHALRTGILLMAAGAIAVGLDSAGTLAARDDGAESRDQLATETPLAWDAKTITPLGELLRGRPPFYSTGVWDALVTSSERQTTPGLWTSCGGFAGLPPMMVMIPALSLTGWGWTARYGVAADNVQVV